MLIIGERINTCRQSVMRAYAERDAGFIRNEALRQAEAGADVIDVNAGSGLDVEPENMAWAVRTVQYIASHRNGGLANGGKGLRRDDKENMR